jgi:hypothetical protein
MTGLECLDGPDDCNGVIEYRPSLSPSGKSFPRCDRHWLKRLDEDEAMTLRVGSWRSDVPPPWFDPLDAGERWDED